MCLGRTSAANHAQQLRQKAQLCRRAADIPTEGCNVDSELIWLAQRLEREAATLEKLLSADLDREIDYSNARE
jgi:hypothetical protein